MLSKELRAGYVSKASFRAMLEAERYGAAFSMGALHSWLDDLFHAARYNKSIDIEGECIIKSQPELLAWIKKHFPDAYSCFYQNS